MFDPAASLMKTIGLALPVEAATVAAAQVPGDGSEAAGNGGFASLLAMKLESAEAPAALPGGLHLPVQPAAELVPAAPQSTAPIDWTAKAQPATGNSLPPALPGTLTPVLPPVLPTPVATAVPVALPVAAPTALPSATAPVLPRKVQPIPASAANVAIPEPAAQEAEPASPQIATTVATPVRRAAARAALAAAPVIREPDAAPEPAKEASAPQVAMQAAMPAVAAKVRPAAARNSAPDVVLPSEPEVTEPVAAESEETTRPEKADLTEVAKVHSAVPAPDLVVPTAIVPAAAVQIANPAPTEFTPSPPLAPAAKAPVAAAPVALAAREAEPTLPVQQALSVQQAETVLSPMVAAQARTATFRLPADLKRPDFEAPQAHAAARRAEEPVLEMPQATAARPLASVAALPATTPAPSLTLVAPQAPALAEVPADFAQIVDRLVAAREAIAPSEVRVTIDHAQFGKVSLGFTPDASGMNVTLAAADPEFARAVEAAAPFAPPVTSEAPQVSPPSPARGADLPSTLTGQQGQQSGRQQPADPRGGSAQANPSTRNPDSETQHGRRRGIFA